MLTSTNRPVRTAFVVRATVKDGLGHLIRSLCVMREMQDLARAKLFLLGDMSGKHLINESSVTWVDCQFDEECARLVLEYKSQIVVFDTLIFEKNAFEQLADETLTVSLSPIFSQMDSVQHLFHRTLHEPPWWRFGKKLPKVHKGLKYAVLPSWLKRLSTSRYREHLHEGKLSIAISMGGADAPNRTLALLQELGKYPKGLVIWVALGEAYTHSYEELLRCAQENRQEIILLKSNESMWRVFRNVSLVICAGGLTTYEAAYVGIPSINILQSQEWNFLFSELTAKNVCYTVNPAEGSTEKTADLVNDLVSDREKLLDMHNLSKNVIPSGGAKRIAKKIIKLHIGAQAT